VGEVAVNAPTRPPRARVESTSPPDVYWAGPGHPLGWVPGHRAYDTARSLLDAPAAIAGPYSLASLRRGVRTERKGGPYLHLDAATDPGDDVIQFAMLGSHDLRTAPDPYDALFACTVNVEVFDRALASLGETEGVAVHYYGHGAPITLHVDDATPPTIVMPLRTCPDEHRRDGGCFWREGDGRIVCYGRDCVMGRKWGWSYPRLTWERPPLKTEPATTHTFHHDGRP